MPRNHNENRPWPFPNLSRCWCRSESCSRPQFRINSPFAVNFSLYLPPFLVRPPAEKMIQVVTDYQGNAIDKLNRTISFNAEFAVKNLDLCVFLTFLTIELNSDVDFQTELKGVYRKYQKFISDLIAQGIRQGVIKKGLDPDLVALSFISFQDGVLHQWVLNRDHLDGREYVKTIRTLIIDGLTA